MDKSIDFSISIVKYCEILDEQRKFIVSRQLLRSGIAIGANVFEVQNAESAADFIHKMKIAAKGCCETLYWLILCERCEVYFFNKRMREDLEQIVTILSKIIATAKKRKYGLT